MGETEKGGWETKILKKGSKLDQGMDALKGRRAGTFLRTIVRVEQ